MFALLRRCLAVLVTGALCVQPPPLAIACDTSVGMESHAMASAARQPSAVDRAGQSAGMVAAMKAERGAGTGLASSGERGPCSPTVGAPGACHGAPCDMPAASGPCAGMTTCVAPAALPVDGMAIALATATGQEAPTSRELPADPVVAPESPPPRA